MRSRIGLCIIIVLSLVMCNETGVFCADDDAIKQWLDEQPIILGERLANAIGCCKVMTVHEGSTLMHIAAGKGRIDVMQ